MPPGVSQNAVQASQLAVQEVQQRAHTLEANNKVLIMELDEKRSLVRFAFVLLLLKGVLFCFAFFCFCVCGLFGTFSKRRVQLASRCLVEHVCGGTHVTVGWVCLL